MASSPNSNNPPKNSGGSTKGYQASPSSDALGLKAAVDALEAAAQAGNGNGLDPKRINPIATIFIEKSDIHALNDLLEAKLFESQLDTETMKLNYELLAAVDESGQLDIVLESVDNELEEVQDSLLAVVRFLKALIVLHKSLSNPAKIASLSFIFTESLEGYNESPLIKIEDGSQANFYDVISDITKLTTERLYKMSPTQLYAQCLEDARAAMAEGVSPALLGVTDRKMSDAEISQRKIARPLNYTKTHKFDDLGGLKTLKHVGLGKLSTNYDSVYSSANGCSADRIPEVSDLNRLHRVMHLCCILAHEMRLSVALGRLEGNGDAATFGISHLKSYPFDNMFGTADITKITHEWNPENSLVDFALVNEDGTTKTNDSKKRALLFDANVDNAIGTRGVKEAFFDTIVNDPTNNKMGEFDDIINKAANRFESAEEILKKAMLVDDEPDLLTGSGLFIRVLEEFCEILKGPTQEVGTTDAVRMTAGLMLLGKAGVNKNERDDFKRKLKQGIIQACAKNVWFHRQEDGQDPNLMRIGAPWIESRLCNDVMGENNNQDMGIFSGLMMWPNDYHFGGHSLEETTVGETSDGGSSVTANTIEWMPSISDWHKKWREGKRPNISGHKHKGCWFVKGETIIQSIIAGAFGEPVGPGIVDRITSIFNDLNQEAVKMAGLDNDGTYINESKTTKNSGFEGGIVLAMLVECFCLLTSLFSQTEFVLARWVHTKSEEDDYEKAAWQKAISMTAAGMALSIDQYGKGDKPGASDLNAKGFFSPDRIKERGHSKTSLVFDIDSDFHAKSLKYGMEGAVGWNDEGLDAVSNQQFQAFRHMYKDFLRTPHGIPFSPAVLQRKAILEVTKMAKKGDFSDLFTSSDVPSALAVAGIDPGTDLSFVGKITPIDIMAAIERAAINDGAVLRLFAAAKSNVTHLRTASIGLSSLSAVLRGDVDADISPEDLALKSLVQTNDGKALLKHLSFRQVTVAMERWKKIKNASSSEGYLTDPVPDVIFTALNLFLESKQNVPKGAFIFLGMPPKLIEDEIVAKEISKDISTFSADAAVEIEIFINDDINRKLDFQSKKYKFLLDVTVDANGIRKAFASDTPPQSFDELVESAFYRIEDANSAAGFKEKSGNSMIMTSVNAKKTKQELKLILESFVTKKFAKILGNHNLEEADFIIKPGNHWPHTRQTDSRDLMVPIAEAIGKTGKQLNKLFGSSPGFIQEPTPAMLAAATKYRETKESRPWKPIFERDFEPSEVTHLLNMFNSKPFFAGDVSSSVLRPGDFDYIFAVFVDLSSFKLTPESLEETDPSSMDTDWLIGAFSNIDAAMQNPLMVGDSWPGGNFSIKSLYVKANVVKK